MHCLEIGGSRVKTGTDVNDFFKQVDSRLKLSSDFSGNSTPRFSIIMVMMMIMKMMMMMNLMLKRNVMSS